MATEIRQRFNAIMKEELAGFKGSCLYVGRADLDGEGGRYRDYGEFSSFKTVDIVGEPDFLCSIEDANVIPSDSFDLVIFCWVVEHVKNPYAAMMEVQRIARMELIVGYPTIIQNMLTRWIYTAFSLAMRRTFLTVWM